MGDTDRMSNVNKVAIEGGLESGGYALLGSMAVSLLANRLSPAYRSLTPPGKVFLVCVVTAGSAIIGAEHAIYHYNRPFLQQAPSWSPTSNDQIDGLFNTVFRHRFELAGGAMVGAVTAGVVYFAGEKGARRTGADKFVSIRLFSHAIGLASIVGLVGMASIARKKPTN